MSSNLRLYPWFKFFQSLIFWQAVWFLFFQERLSGAEAILLYAVYDIATVALEVPSGYLSDRIGRRVTLILSAVAGVVGAVLLVTGGDFWIYAAGMTALGAAAAFASGTDSSLLYESLAQDGRTGEIETRELWAWRATFSALALSAVTGGAMAAADPVLPFLASVVSAAICLAITFGFREPGTGTGAAPKPDGGAVLSLLRSLRNPVLAWCFVLAVAMYAFSHVPFVFGQPFILDALAARGWSGEAPLVSGTVVTAMMVISLAASWAAPRLRRAIGLGGILLVALAMQVGLIGALTASDHIAVIALLLLRMVPDSLSRPFVLARIQPLLEDGRRATYLSVQSFFGRLLFAGSLIALSTDASDTAALSHTQMQAILIWYVAAGLAVLAALGVTLRAVAEDRHARPAAGV